MNLESIKKAMEKQFKQLEENRKNGIVSPGDRAYLDLAQPTYIENWNPKLFDFSIPTTLISMTKEETETLIAIGDGQIPYNEGSIPKGIAELWNKVEQNLRNYPNGAFIRLGSRSPKDSWTGANLQFRHTETFTVFASLVESIRIFEDLCLAGRAFFTPTLVLRQWLPIEQWREFRCFAVNGELKGISQYFYQEKQHFPEIESQKEDVLAQIKDKYEEMKEIMPSTVIFDMLYSPNDDTRLLEINPYSNRFTDPCLFDWRTDTFETFSFKYIKKTENN